MNFKPTPEAPARYEVMISGCGQFHDTREEVGADIRSARENGELDREGEYAYVIDHLTGERFDI